MINIVDLKPHCSYKYRRARSVGTFAFEEKDCNGFFLFQLSVACVTQMRVHRYAGHILLVRGSAGGFNWSDTANQSDDWLSCPDLNSGLADWSEAPAPQRR